MKRDRPPLNCGKESNLTASELRRIGQALYGSRWQTELARALGLSPRYIRRLAAGTSPMTASLAGRVREVVARRQAEIAGLDHG